MLWLSDEKLGGRLGTPSLAWEYLVFGQVQLGSDLAGELDLAGVG